MGNKKEKFTPGPWYSGTDTNGTNVSTAGQGIICELTSNGCKPLRGAELNQAHNREANAHLIAAAPDLYEALDLFLQGFDEKNNGKEKRQKLLGLAINKAEQALAKARGES